MARILALVLVAAANASFVAAAQDQSQIGRPSSEVVAELEAAGHEVIVVNTRGFVVEPAADDMVLNMVPDSDAPGATVQVSVATASQIGEFVSAPELEGKSVAEAVSIASASGLSLLVCTNCPGLAHTASQIPSAAQLNGPYAVEEQHPEVGARMVVGAAMGAYIVLKSQELDEEIAEEDVSVVTVDRGNPLDHPLIAALAGGLLVLFTVVVSAAVFGRRRG